MEKQEHTSLIARGDMLDDPKTKEAVKRILEWHGLATKEFVEQVVYIGVAELKQFERDNSYPRWLAEGSLRAILSDLRDVSPALEIRTIYYDEQNLPEAMIAFNDLDEIVQSGRINQIMGLGRSRQRFLEHFVSEAHGEDYYADLHQPMA